MKVEGDYISGFEGSFDYDTASELVKHLREHAARIAGASPSCSDYDPETLALEHDAASAIELLLTSRNYERDCALSASSKATELASQLADAQAMIEDLEDLREQMTTRAYAMLMWAPKDDANRKWFEELEV